MSVVKISSEQYMTASQITSYRELADYPQIKKLAVALHRLDASHHGAAILVGAGFSRSAAIHVGGEKRVPLWNQFTKKLAKMLYPKQSDLTFMDPLRVAEEFRAYFGQAVLNDQIRLQIEDEAWRNGSLYKELLSLPWTDVLTTNWDTLLERAAADLSSPYYTTVTKPSDLAWAPAPRVVKLHGTIGLTDVLIAAQEDFRGYSTKFAPFVNLARQIFIENELCLLGFSGDDPNFLAWAGWVRDHLANHARKIYLVGVLDLPAARRTQLELMNIAPIDLGPLVADIPDLDLKHQRATEQFIQALSDELKSTVSPQDWKPQRIEDDATSVEEIRGRRDPAVGASRLIAQLETLRATRESYPGWLVCPPTLRWGLGNQVSSPSPSTANLTALDANNRAKILYELCWRHTTAFEPMEGWLADMLFDVADPGAPTSIPRRHQLEIALALLNHGRSLPVETETERHAAERLESKLIGILEKYSDYLPDCKAEIAYHRALVFRDKLDYPGLAGVVDDLDGTDSVWKLRKAAMLSELGRSTASADLIRQTYGELLRAHRSDRRSISITSRLVWAHWLLQVVQTIGGSRKKEELPSFVEQNYRIWKCDPWALLDDFRSQLEKRFEKHVDKQELTRPLFPQGHYRENRQDDSMDDKQVEIFIADALTRTVGIPLQLGGAGMGANLLVDDIKRIILTGGTGGELRDYTWTIRSAGSDDSEVIAGVFTRVGVAKANLEVIETLVHRARAAFAYWRTVRDRGGQDERGEALHRLRVFLEVLGRLVVRVPQDTAKELFLFAATQGHEAEMQHGSVSNALRNVLTNSLASLPRVEQAKLLPAAIGFPLASEIKGGRHQDWANPLVRCLDERETYSPLEGRISQLIAAAAVIQRDIRFYPLLRLCQLSAKKGFLNSAEREKLATAIWGSNPDYSRLPDTGLLPHTFLELPSADEVRTEAIVRSELFEVQLEVLAATKKELNRYPPPEIQRAVNWCEGMASAVRHETLNLAPTPEQAVKLFEALVAWRPSAHKSALFGASHNDRLAGSIGSALSNAIAPNLPPEYKSRARFAELSAFHLSVSGSESLLPAYVYFRSADSEIPSMISRLLKKALSTHDQSQIYYAAIAAYRWSQLVSPGQETALDSLISFVLAVVEAERTTGLHQLIWLLTQLFGAGWLSEIQTEMLAEKLPAIFEAMRYENILPRAPEMVNASTVRAACVVFARALLQQLPNDEGLVQLIAKSRDDPLPEVRFAEPVED